MIKKHIESYMRHLEIKGYAKKTIKLYARYTEEQLEYFSHILKIDRVQDIRKEHIKAYSNNLYEQRSKRTNKEYSVSYKQNKLKALKRFFKYLTVVGELLYNPAEIVELPRRGRSEIRESIKEKDMKKLLETVDVSEEIGLRDRAIIECLYATGIRNEELRNIKLRDIDMANGELYVREGKGYFGKRERVVPMGSIAKMYIEEYLNKVRRNFINGTKDESYLFISYRGNKMDETDLARMVKRYAIKAHIKRRVTPHIIRHSCATHMLRGGADIRYVQELLGHKSLDSTKVYTKLKITDLKKAHRKSHPRERKC